MRLGGSGHENAQCEIFPVTGRRGMEARGQGYNGH
jgi:hypothetical protein